MTAASLPFLTLDDFDATDQTVIMRADLDVPINNGQVTDDTRLKAFLPTLTQLIKKKAKIILLGHFKRPEGQIVPEMSLKPVCKHLEKLIQQPIAFFQDTPPTLKSGQIAMYENVRFDPREEQNDPSFAQELSNWGDCFVFDAFATYRAHASTVGITNFLPSYAGRLVEKEYTSLQAALENPDKPLMAIVGGAKTSTKLDLLHYLAQKTDYLILGGGMANTFLFAQGKAIGQSLCEKDMTNKAQDIMQKAQQHGCEIILPLDAVTAKELTANTPTHVRSVDDIQTDEMILDIGPESVHYIEDSLKKCRTLLWNGPVGAFETPPFEKGTMAIAQQVSQLTQKQNLFSVAGGGDTVSALNMAGVKNSLSYVSTAGGAFLKMTEGKKLETLSALSKHKS